MDHETPYDEASNIAVIRVKGRLTEDDIAGLSADNRRYKENYSVVLDLRQATEMLYKKTRHRLKVETADNPPARTAIIVTNPGVRITVNCLMRFSGKSTNTRFFENQTGTLAWLKEGLSKETKAVNTNLRRCK